METKHISQVSVALSPNTNPEASERKKPLQVLSQTSSTSPTLAQASDGRKALSVLLFEQFELLNVWGKSPDALQAIARGFAGHLADYPLDKIIAAFRLHASRSGDFPTPADIIGLIRRGGRPPFERVVYVNISKKQFEDRTDEEREYIRAYEADQMGGEAIFRTSEDYDRIRGENVRLRQKNAELERENERLGELLTDARRGMAFPLPKPSHGDKVQKTAQWMRDNGYPEKEIEDFLAAEGSAA